MPCRPSQPVPLWGGMRIPSPRTKAEAVVFAVMANPEVLRINGKNAEDPEKRSSLIELMLDFVEAMNVGLIFLRRYTILKDRDITGELKEVWNAVQARRDREQPPPQQETWIDAQPPVPQYPQYQDQQQQTQKQQQDYTSQQQQPPQYHSSIAYGRAISSDNMHYDGYGYQSQKSVIPPNDQMYQSSQIVSQQYGNVTRIAQDRYNYRERGRDTLVQNIPQQSCPAYPAPQYQFQQLPRQMMPQYVNSNVHPNTNLGYGPPTNTSVNPNMPAAFQSYITNPMYQQRMDNTIHVDIRRMQQQQQQQQQQIHINHAQQVPQYEPAGDWQTVNVLRLGRPHMGVIQKNTVSKRQVNSPTHSKQASCTNCHNKSTTENVTKPKSPVKVLQRELSSSGDRQDNTNYYVITDNSKTMRREKVYTEEIRNLRPTNDVTRDNEGKKFNECSSSIESNDTSKKSNDSYTSLSTSNTRKTINSNENNQDNGKQQQDTKDFDLPTVSQMIADQNFSSRCRIIVGRIKHKDNNVDNNRTIWPRFASDQKNDSPKRSQTNVNSIINPGMSNNEETSSIKKKTTNGQQPKGKNAKAYCENDDIQQGYTILKKTETIVQDDVINDIAQISIQDCKDGTEVISPVLS
ncbi:transcription activator MSS11 isoform X2 [Vespa velutina]|uniref:transcription activator MSS11 isoform X2 n=2 Tax=Vespa velutina TaxID=202808 RepID=UPI001FB45F29|nr:transcription activator MSS11 isoform X2 [Vespa velutina]